MYEDPIYSLASLAQRILHVSLVTTLGRLHEPASGPRMFQTYMQRGGRGTALTLSNTYVNTPTLRRRTLDRFARRTLGLAS